jgi:hypothetical protein
MLTPALLLALAASQPVPFDASTWTIDDPGSRTMTYLGRPSLFLDNGTALLRDSAFGDGTIEFDIAMHGHASFAGVVFRAASGEDYELVYVRPHRSRQPDALQYTPVFNGSSAWQLYSGDGYTAAAELPLNRWVHVKLVAAGYTARLFVDGAAEPQLTVTSLERPWARGRVGLWSGLGGANFANFTVTPADTTAPAARPAAPAPPRTMLTTWELSPAFETASVSPDTLPAVRGGAPWTRITAEPSGLVNIARYRASVRTAASAAKGSLDLVFARTTITSQRTQQMRLVFAYSDRIRIFVNGRPVFSGDSPFQSRDPSFLGVASLGPDAVYVDLRPGANDIVLAVAEKFGGWGFAARLEPLGPEYEPSGHNSTTPQRPTPK